MMGDILDYFAKRAFEEDRLATTSVHPSVKATHASFAAAYRAQAKLQTPTLANDHPLEDVICSRSRINSDIVIYMVFGGVFTLVGLTSVVLGEMPVLTVGIVSFIGIFLIMYALLLKLSLRRKPTMPVNL